jgi:Na+/proline symporter
MSLFDYVVLLGTMVGIAVYGVWQARGRKNLSAYLRSAHTLGWGTVGLSVMATQASAITFLSMPGQAYESGLGFVQNYFGLPIALIIVAAVFLPIYRRLNVYTAYEYLGHRFDSKTRLLGAGLFLLQRGLAAGLTIYAPAIILSTVLGWRLDATIVLTGLFVIIYTAVGGNEAVSVTQKWQMAVIFAGMAAAFAVLLAKLPSGLGLTDTLAVAGSFNKLQAVDFSIDFHKRYTVWSGVLGGLFLSLSYFGTDQSQVQRYLSGATLRESRLGLMFNAVLKIPMQFFILLLGALVFVFYQFETPPVFFNRATWAAHATGDAGAGLRAIETRFDAAHNEQRAKIHDWLAARHGADPEPAKAAMLAAHQRTEALRTEARQALAAADPIAQKNDADYVFITFVLEQMPHGIIGLLIALVFAAAVSSLSSELAALGETTTIDLYRHVLRTDASDLHYVRVSKALTAFWGLIAIGFALFAHLAENLIQAVNILGSIFYGVVLGLFLVAFFLRRIGGTAVFWGAVAAQALVFALYFSLNISYLWYNFIGCAACVLFSLILQSAIGSRGATAQPGCSILSSQA